MQGYLCLGYFVLSTHKMFPVGSQILSLYYWPNPVLVVGGVKHFVVLPYVRKYKSRYLSVNMIPHRQLVLYTGSTLGEEIMPKES